MRINEKESEDNRVQNYQKLELKPGEFFIVPNAIFELDLPYPAIALYAYIMKMEDHSNFTCHPSFEQIGQALQMSPNTITKYAHLLQRKGLIYLERTKYYTESGRKMHGRININILPIKPIWEVHQEKKLQLQLAAMRQEAALREYDKRHKK